MGSGGFALFPQSRASRGRCHHAGCAPPHLCFPSGNKPFSSRLICLRRHESSSRSRGSTRAVAPVLAFLWIINAVKLQVVLQQLVCFHCVVWDFEGYSSLVRGGISGGGSPAPYLLKSDPSTRIYRFSAAIILLQVLFLVRLHAKLISVKWKWASISLDTLQHNKVTPHPIHV